MTYRFWSWQNRSKILQLNILYKLIVQFSSVQFISFKTIKWYMRYMNRRNIFTYEQNGCKVQKHQSKHALITHYVALNTRTYLIIIKRLWLRRQKKACKICILIIWCNPVNYNSVNIFWYACERLYLRFRLLHYVSKWYTKYISFT